MQDGERRIFGEARIFRGNTTQIERAAAIRLNEAAMKASGA
jgi:hypothetical protein